ncbi:hypothetical protein C0J52_16546 [Blattella germanica]|nr:hypothetical protein C0J52_16546 [Blattella germanica]
MCKSEGGGCFSDLEDYSDVYRAKHGCLEMLDRRQQEHCHEPGSNPAHPAVLWCCHKDMCNHIDSPENFKFNTSEDRLFFNGAPQTPIGYNNNEVWFKAATIAVPICGALILFVLIALAIKILRRDGIEQGFIHGSKHGGGIFPPSASHALVLPSTRKASQYHLHNLDDMSSKKVPLLLQHRNESSPSPQCIMLMNPNSVPTKTSGVGGQQFEKNEANAKLNLAGKSCLLSEQSTLSDYTLLVHPLQQSQDLNPSPINLLQKPNNNTANTNLYRNVNLTLAPVPSQQMPLPAESKLYDKQHLASVVTWGEATGSASHV